MHEYSIVASLIDTVAAEVSARGATRAVRLEVDIGELAGVEASLLATAYEVFREHTVCAGAPLEIHAVPARWVCSECGEPIAPGAILRCRSCGRPGRLAGGDEIVLSRIELEVDDV